MNAFRQRLASLPRDARDTLFLLLVIAWVVLPHTGSLPVWCSALAAGVLLWRGRLAVAQRPLPGRWALLAALGLALAGTLFSYRTLLGREAGVALLAALLALKTLELRARRDAFVVFFLGFFLLLAGFFNSQSMLAAAAALLGLLGLLTALVNAHRPVGRPSLLESARMAGWLALTGAPLMLALFLLFPRFAPLWGLPSDALQGKTGLSSSMEVGSVAKLALDEGIAMRIKFDGSPPPQSALYFRGPVLSHFDGRRWTAAAPGPGSRADGSQSGRGPEGPEGPEDAATLMPGPGDLQVAGSPVRYEVTLEPSQRLWLLPLDVASQPPELPAGMRARMTADMQWMSWRPITDLLRYRAVSHPQFRYGLKNPFRKDRPPDLRPWLQLPAGSNPRTQALAGQMRQQTGGDARALMQAALQRLRTGGYTYTLEPGVSGQHSADTFWFDSKEGFCEHIASAFVLLMRGAGVPARIVTGFQGGELNSVDGYWAVRNADAHAWAEVWLPDEGWTRVDPTGAVMPGRIGQYQRLRAPDGLMAGAINTLSPGLLAQLRALWEAADNSWKQWVINYTQTRQFDLMKSLGMRNPDWMSLLRLSGILLALAGLAAAGWALWERRQRDPWLRALAHARQRLAQAGLPLPASATPRALAAAVQAAPWPQELRQPWRQSLLALEAWRYAPPASGHGHSASALAALRRQLQRLPLPAPPKR